MKKASGSAGQEAEKEAAAKPALAPKATPSSQAALQRHASTLEAEKLAESAARGAREARERLVVQLVAVRKRISELRNKVNLTESEEGELEGLIEDRVELVRSVNKLNGKYGEDDEED